MLKMMVKKKNDKMLKYITAHTWSWDIVNLWFHTNFASRLSSTNVGKKHHIAQHGIEFLKEQFEHVLLNVD